MFTIADGAHLVPAFAGDSEGLKESSLHWNTQHEFYRLRRCPMSVMQPEYFFAYGTLRRTSKGTHVLLTPHAEYFADGYIQGRLYEIHGYPGAVETAVPDERVRGEVYRVLAHEELFERLDRYEECTLAFTQPHEYVRTVVQVKLTRGGSLAAWTYLFNRSIAGRRRLTGGDYAGNE